MGDDCGTAGCQLPKPLTDDRTAAAPRCLAADAAVGRVSAAETAGAPLTGRALAAAGCTAAA